MSPRRLGLFGGTFDPPHLGHVAALTAAWRTGWFDALMVTVAGDPYAKSPDQTVSPAAHRLAMAHAAFDDLPGVTVSDREVRRPGPTYTIDTVRELVAESWTVVLVVGADAAASLDRWREAPALAALCTVAIVPRVGEPVTLASPWRARFVTMAPVDLSSSWIREHESGSLEALLPRAVVPLYRAGEG